MKRITYIFAFILLFSLPVIGEEQLVDRIVAEVDNEIITYKQLESVIAPVVAQIDTVGYSESREKEIIEELTQRMLQNLIDEKIAEISAKRSKIEVDKSDIDKFIARVRAEQNISEENFGRALEMRGLTITEYRDRIKKDILKKRLIDFEVRSKIVITSVDIKKYYDSHPDEYGDKTEYKIWHITFPKGSYSSEESQAVFDLAEKIRAVAMEKNDFKSVSENIKNYSEKFKVLSGDLGYFSTKDLSKEVNELVSRLDKGDFSRVVATSRGIQTFFIEDKRISKIETLESATPKIKRILYNEEVERRFATWIDKLKENMHIRIIE